MDNNAEKSREQRIDEMLAKHEIREALTAFSRGMDRFDKASYDAAFHEDAQTAAGPFVGTASDCWDWAVPMHEAYQILTHHSLLNSTIDLDGDAAHCETYYIFVARNKDESITMAGGRYIDRFEKRDGAWKIALRTNVIEWNCAPDAAPIPFADVPGIADNGVSSRGLDDPSYQRPLANQRASFNPAKGG